MYALDSVDLVCIKFSMAVLSHAFVQIVSILAFRRLGVRLQGGSCRTWQCEYKEQQEGWWAH